MNIGERLKRIRKEKGMTQDSVAERAGVTATSISRWENGERDPTFRDVEKIAAALGVTMEELTREQKRGTGIRKIIDGKLYDTGNARILFEFRRKYQDPLNPLFFGKKHGSQRMGGRAISENRTGRVSVLLSEKERSSGRDGKRGKRHDPETKR